jgi:alanyl-tRNA synthetase
MQQPKKFLLSLDLQKFADDPNPADNPTPTGADNPADNPVADQKIPYDRFKQKVDEANELKRKLVEFEQAKEEAERNKLEEANEFKLLYEKSQADIEAIRKEAEQTKLESTKTNLLVSAGYTGEQLERVRKYIVGTNDEELMKSLEELKQDIPPKAGGVDPSVNNPQRQQPQSKDLADEGRSIYERLKAAGKIRR